MRELKVKVAVNGVGVFDPEEQMKPPSHGPDGSVKPH